MKFFPKLLPVFFIFVFFTPFSAYSSDCDDLYLKAMKGEISSSMLDLCKKEAMDGNDKTQLILGYMYQNGVGVTKDEKQAADWYLRSAKAGYAMAQFNIGKMYEDGIGVKQDYTQAVYWYKKAESLMNGKAAYALGSLYYQGKGVRANEK
ncbi:sel1 repeat family protein, partial [Providencia rettgeri]|uniref:tetratricopeptide repeat protein n=1 Tax=Providencia rettgeri TaxID=587 RepID=UPI0014046794